MLPLNLNLQGKVAAVTGGGGVLCGCMARELTRQGMKVAILNTTFEKQLRLLRTSSVKVVRPSTSNVMS